MQIKDKYNPKLKSTTDSYTPPPKTGVIGKTKPVTIKPGSVK